MDKPLITWCGNLCMRQYHQEPADYPKSKPVNQNCLGPSQSRFIILPVAHVPSFAFRSPKNLATAATEANVGISVLAIDVVLVETRALEMFYQNNPKGHLWSGVLAINFGPPATKKRAGRGRQTPPPPPGFWLSRFRVGSSAHFSVEPCQSKR